MVPGDLILCIVRERLETRVNHIFKIFKFIFIKNLFFYILNGFDMQILKIILKNILKSMYLYGALN